MSDTKKPATTRARDTAGGFTDEERAAMKERAREVRAPARPGSPNWSAGPRAETRWPAPRAFMRPPADLPGLS
jgi:hypothetical protein